MMRSSGLVLVAALALAGAASAYPGGTPSFQTDVAPFCSGCHSSRSALALAGAPGGRAEKELAENKHLPLIENGEGGYAELSASQRAELMAHVRALDAASTVRVEAPESVTPGETFTVTVAVTGGAGPVVGVGLVDADHRWHARPASSAGWQVVGEPRIVSGNGEPQTEWLHRRPAERGRNLSFVNVAGISSDASKGEYARASVTWTLRAPSAPGTVPLGAAFWYGTEKGSPLGYTEDPIRGKQVRGSFTGYSGRVLFAPVRQVRVQ